MSNLISSLTAKIVLALLIALGTLWVSQRISEYNFNRVKGPIDQLAAPSPQLELVNRLFKNVVRLDLNQRVSADRSTGLNYVSFVSDTRSTNLMLDTLRSLSNGNEEQLQRIERMKLILKQRNGLFVEYLNLRNNFRKNDSLGDQINQLSDFVTYFSMRGDSSMYSSESHITHTVVESELPATATEPEKRNLVDRVLGRKPVPPPLPSKEINHYVFEQKTTSVDTETLKREDSIINSYSAAITNIEKIRKQQLANIAAKRNNFEQANSKLISEMLVILDQMEATERTKATSSNLLATKIIDTGLKTTNIILMVFLVLTALLALLIFFDIGRSNRFKKQLIQAKEEADALGSVKQQFLANMSHELRTPLQSIVGYSELMLRDKQQQTDAHLQVVNQSSQHLLNIVNQILDYSSISADRFSISNKPFSIKQLLQEVYHAVLIQAKQKGLLFETNISLEDAYVVGDAFRLKQVLLNLLNNAVKFTDAGSISLQVKQTKGKVATAYTFIVSDTGRGIRQEALSRIFNDFEQINPTHLHNGNGLGLSITKKIIEKHNGTIEVESEPGRGTIFKVQINYANSSAPAVEELPAYHAGGDMIRIARGMVWLIDDDVYILELCSKILSQNHIPHQCFSTHRELMRAPVPPDLKAVFMDIRMPEISGMDLLPVVKDKLKADVHDVCFIALTAQVLPEETESLRSHGFDYILHKPFRIDDLLALFDLSSGRRTPLTNVADDQDIQKIFAEETSKDIQQVRQLLSNEAFEEIAAYFHRVASRLSQMGYRQLGQETRKLEVGIRNGSFHKESIATVCSEIEQVLA